MKYAVEVRINDRHEVIERDKQRSNPPIIHEVSKVYFDQQDGSAQVWLVRGIRITGATNNAGIQPDHVSLIPSRSSRLTLNNKYILEVTNESTGPFPLSNGINL